MTKRSAILAAASMTLALAACSEAGDSPQTDAAEASADLAADNAEAASADAPAPLTAAMPQLAYAFGLSYRLPSADIGELMRRHASVCEQQGPASCRIVGMDLTGSAADETVRGTLQLAVAAPHARALSALMEDEAGDAGAEQVSATIGSEEVSKTIVDTEARIRAREDLRDRLQQVLRTRQGSVRELVEAERGVAAVNEEIDQARAWLAETKGRVAFSRMAIDYAPAAAPAHAFLSPVKSALGSLGGILGTVLAALIVMAAIAGPLAGSALGLRWLVRRLRRPEESAA